MTKLYFINMGERIRKQRLKLGFTQENLAEMIDASIQMISDTECGKKGLRLENFIKLCSVLKVSADYLITGREPASVLFQDVENLTEEQYEHVSNIIKSCIALCKNDDK